MAGARAGDEGEEGGREEGGQDKGRGRGGGEREVDKNAGQAERDKADREAHPAAQVAQLTVADVAETSALCAGGRSTSPRGNGEVRGDVGRQGVGGVGQAGRGGHGEGGTVEGGDGGLERGGLVEGVKAVTDELEAARREVDYVRATLAQRDNVVDKLVEALRSRQAEVEDAKREMEGTRKRAERGRWWRGRSGGQEGKGVDSGFCERLSDFVLSTSFHRMNRHWKTPGIPQSRLVNLETTLHADQSASHHTRTGLATLPSGPGRSTGRTQQPDAQLAELSNQSDAMIRRHMALIDAAKARKEDLSAELREPEEKVARREREMDGLRRSGEYGGRIVKLEAEVSLEAAVQTQVEATTRANGGVFHL
ncbi:hypothetical protein HDU93_000720 [Gonapodya sp. JEL0774]|nr:hypothetical protein HDU93_000720 [Gonapodya sp. JEL0774]